MTVTAPTADVAGAALDAQIATVQALVNATSPAAAMYPQYVQQLNQLQTEAVDHYMVTGWLNAATILATYTAPTWDSVGQTLTARVSALQTLVNNAPAAPAGNADGFGAGGIVWILQNYKQQLYAAQIALVERIMDVPGGTPAATILANMTGVQTAPAGITFDYVFSSVGFTDTWIDD
ncbi:MAG TPA: hypothetical protein VGU20_30995 [Stellaceae bacterium]|nr:hypothetical protein [Terriglobia bacterium]HEV2551778.1 hypothetical protein [Stellaceae bacterium]